MISPEIKAWLKTKEWQLLDFQLEALKYYEEGYSGIINAPTGSGKTLAVLLPILQRYFKANSKANVKSSAKETSKLQVLWLTPLKALAQDIKLAIAETIRELNIPWSVELRTGDVSYAIKKKQFIKTPEILVITPESLHLLLSQTGSSKLLTHLTTVVVDEWHELLSTKRGVQVELALARLKAITTNLQIWGISATIGNLEQALDVLITKPGKIIRANLEKELEIITLFPKVIENYTWSGHLGLQLLPQVLEIINSNNSTLIFCNTRSHVEMWYKNILQSQPTLEGKIGIHHSSLAKADRNEVELKIKENQLKIVVATSSLDLGVDFKAVDAVIQVGSPKGISRFVQRAGRSGHEPGRKSKIYFLPTNSLELLDAAALKEGIAQKQYEEKLPVIKPLDVLIQYLVSLSCGDGFSPNLFTEIKTTYSYSGLQESEWEWIINYLTTGGESLAGYPQYSKLKLKEGVYTIREPRFAKSQRLGIGTIVSEVSMRVQFSSGKSLGTIEEDFISRLKPNEVFYFSGRYLKLVRVQDLTAIVRKSSPLKTSTIPRWLGGRMLLSTKLAQMIRLKLAQYLAGNNKDIELVKLTSLLKLQQKLSAIPNYSELLVEKIQTTDGYHLFIYPFAGRAVHEVLAALFALRISRIKPLSFSLAMNDYGFELLSEKSFWDELDLKKLFTTHNLEGDLKESINLAEMAKHKFREVAQIAGLINQGYPGEKGGKQLQVSAGLLFTVFEKYEPTNLIYQQALTEVLELQLAREKVVSTLLSMSELNLLITYSNTPTPFSFPIIIDSLRSNLSSEEIELRIAALKLA